MILGWPKWPVVKFSTLKLSAALSSTSSTCRKTMRNTFLGLIRVRFYKNNVNTVKQQLLETALMVGYKSFSGKQLKSIQETLLSCKACWQHAFAASYPRLQSIIQSFQGILMRKQNVHPVIHFKYNSSHLLLFLDSEVCEEIGTFLTTFIMKERRNLLLLCSYK